MKNIVLIGMSGVGKSEKGKYLAKKLNWKFFDTDDIIVEQEKATIDDIFTKYGEDYFRNIEMKVIDEISKLSNTVISTGGGIVTRSINIENLRKNGYIFLFVGKIQTIVSNLNSSNVIRPLLKDNADLFKMVESLYKNREKAYIDASDLIINVDDKTLEDISIEIIEAYEKLLSCSK